MLDGIFILIEKIERLFGRALESGILYIILGVILFLLFILGVVLLIFWIKGDPTEKTSDAYKIITEKAPFYCAEKGFNSWNFVNRNQNTDAENKRVENLTFICVNVKNETGTINEYAAN